VEKEGEKDTLSNGAKSEEKELSSGGAKVKACWGESEVEKKEAEKEKRNCPGFLPRNVHYLGGVNDPRGPRQEHEIAPADLSGAN